MPKFRITEIKPAVLHWEFVVEAESEEEALRMVKDEEVDPIEHDWEETFDPSEYEVEEA